MASSFTYATMKAALQAWVEDVGATFGSDVDTCIKLGEDRVLKDLQLSIFDANESLTGINAATHAKPTSTLLTRSLYILVNGEKTFLQKRTKSYCESYWPDATDTGTPKFFADDYSSSSWLIVPTPAATYTGSASVVKRPASLVTDTSGTWLSTNVGDLLFKASLIEATIYGIADERLAALGADYEKALSAARLEFKSLIRTDYGPLGAQPEPRGEL